jgi:pimeloyl-ACP methyl ester carboxylesterase
VRRPRASRMLEPVRRRPRPGLGRRAVALAGLAVIAGGCAAASPGTARASPARSGTASPSAPAAPVLDGCFTAARGAVETVPDAGGGRLALGIVGTGPRVVVLSEQSDEDLCSWLPLAARLAAAGYRAVLWDYGGNLPPDELAVLVRALRGSGATRIALMGASEGAKASLIAGAQIRPAVAGVVSLSAEYTLGPGISVAGYVRHLQCPLLLVTALQDDFAAAPAARQYLALAPAAAKSLVTVPGSDHGTALLSGRSAATVLPAVLAFLHRVLG